MLGSDDLGVTLLAGCLWQTSTHGGLSLAGYSFAMKHLFVEILAEDVVIGTANLSPADPSMGVAFATFQPNPAYAINLHSRASEQRELDATPSPLSVRTDEGVHLQCAGIDLVDFAATLGDEGREIHVLGLEGFQSYFG
jgi:hypothetical protein